MRRLFLGTTLSLAFAFAPPALAAKDKQAAPKTERVEKDEGEVKGGVSKEEQAKIREHLKMRNYITKQVKYPTSKDKLVRGMNSTSIKPDDRKWVEQTLPERTFESSEEVMRDLGWPVENKGAEE